MAALIRDGRLRALAITDEKRHPMFPTVPTMKDLGFADFETYVFASLYARGETPDDITNKLADTVRAAMLSSALPSEQVAVSSRHSAGTVSVRL